MTALNRSEILFLYDVTDANPNGDPVDENKPRIDEETGINIVTDVRLKRTIRDYLHTYKNQEIFILEQKDAKGDLKTKEDQYSEYGNSTETLVARCVDMRLFGATIAVKTGKTKSGTSVRPAALVGPIQFKFGRSLHKVDLTYVRGTTVMPSKEGKQRGAFTEKYVLPYSLIAFYGVVNEKAAQEQNIPLTSNDVFLLLDAMWNGTKNLLSTSKAGQMPRLLIQVEHVQGSSHFGELDKRIRIRSDRDDTAIRDIAEVKLEIDELVNLLRRNREEIAMIRFKIDERVRLSFDGAPTTLDGALAELPHEELMF